ncbi:hypothetical protein J2Y54_000072 [Sphingomonas sp. BE123]|jgi:hypothetical protein|uniref:hypothetical protein n=1 Tax=Sphingomonas sp. BE123 TaxID=2817842 RepID=UPI0028570ABD|nr:hypothetical protein [Sphingomonas sp. BE123]MDR6850579.1 hypothetical protein [Sphingomonas sp. BE123]
MIPVTMRAGEAHGRVVASVADQYEVIRDDRLGLLRIRCVGLRLGDEVDRYLAVLDPIVADMRACFGRVRVLADLRNAPIRTQDAADRMRAGNLRLYRAGDRVALIVESSLLKMQLRRTLVAYQNIFVSPNAAETWATAEV